VQARVLMTVVLLLVKDKDLSEKVVVGLKPFHVGLLICAQVEFELLNFHLIKCVVTRVHDFRWLS
jgi:predicted nuclease of predicted toxin-antitoxin system